MRIAAREQHLVTCRLKLKESAQPSDDLIAGHRYLAVSKTPGPPVTFPVKLNVGNIEPLGAQHVAKLPRLHHWDCRIIYRMQ